MRLKFTDLRCKKITSIKSVERIWLLQCLTSASDEVMQLWLSVIPGHEVARRRGRQSMVSSALRLSNIL
jgi:hypothetical protein